MTKQEKLYDVFKPTYKKAGLNHKGKQMFDVVMKKIGEADSMEEARNSLSEKFPILAAKTSKLYAELTKEQDFGYDEHEGAGYA